MEYNTERPQMQIPEYGRNVHNMVKYCMSIEDREHRNKVAQSIIDVIGNLNPHLRDVPDFKHKLWDHLFIMSEFQLDVDSPYPIPQRESFQEKPQLLDYPKRSNTRRHFGNIIKDMVKVAAEMPDGELKDGLVQSIANQMKKSYLQWNKDTVEDEIILKEMREISNGKLNPKLEDVEFWNSSNVVTQNHPHHQQNKNRGKKRNKGNHRKQRFKK
ncbi:MAG: DUF4290 domain-containing protein [Bacteroidota bacterium]|nr:DUF4290 domain-containing protein [Bacteroidota bacterium]